MELINAIVAVPERARESARECYPLGQPVEVISGEVVVAHEYREAGHPGHVSFRDGASHETVRLEVWGEVLPAEV
jgi:hypothetical protein